MSEYDDDFIDDETPYMSDDDEYERDGTHTLLTTDNESRAKRDEIARILEGLVQTAFEWSEISEDHDAQGIYEELAALYERVSEPLEETDDEVLE